MLEKGGSLAADVFVCAAGCHYNLKPAFLAELGIGKQLGLPVGDIRRHQSRGRHPYQAPPGMALPAASYPPHPICLRCAASRVPPCAAGAARRPAPPPPPPAPPPAAGFEDIHNYCFMGANPRIGTASDFVFGAHPRCSACASTGTQTHARLCVGQALVPAPLAPVHTQHFAPSHACTLWMPAAQPMCPLAPSSRWRCSFTRRSRSRRDARR